MLLVFAIHCLLLSALSANILALVTAHTQEDGQGALDRRLNIAALGLISSVWVLSLISGVRARRFLWCLTAVFLTLVVANLTILPVSGTVTAVERFSTSWGEEIAVLNRGAPTRWLAVAYAGAFAANIFGFVCAARLWSRDRIGGGLLAVASCAIAAGLVRSALVDAGDSRGLYTGAPPYAVWVLLFAVQIAREYRQRGERLAAAQRTVEESRQQLKRLADGLLIAREEERTTIAREIHDVLGQSLTALKMDTAWIGLRVPQAPPALHAKLASMASLIDDAVVTVRRIATDLRPGILDDLGLTAALEWQAQQFEQRTGIHCTLRASTASDAIDSLVATAMFRIFQEALTNVTRHSRASCVTAALAHSGTDLVLEVHDDGVGITSEQASATRSIGLAGMRERAQLAGGTFVISGAAGGGTTIRVQIPQREAVGA